VTGLLPQVNSLSFHLVQKSPVSRENAHERLPERRINLPALFFMKNGCR
jgi:hypothetical protein